MTEERQELIVPLLKQLESGLGGQARLSRKAPRRRWGMRLGQASAEPTGFPPEDVPIVEPFLDGLGVAYAFDLPYGYRLLAQRHCIDVGVPPESLRAQAMANLRARRPEVTLFQSPNATAIAIATGGDWGGDLESSLVLDDLIMTRLAEKFSGDLVVAIPDRDTLVATGTGHADGLAELRSFVERTWPVADHPLAQSPLVRRAGEWQFFETT